VRFLPRAALRLHGVIQVEVLSDFFITFALKKMNVFFKKLTQILYTPGVRLEEFSVLTSSRALPFSFQFNRKIIKRWFFPYICAFFFINDRNPKRIPKRRKDRSLHVGR